MAKKAKAKKKFFGGTSYLKGWKTRRANAAKLGTSVHKFASKAIVKTRRVVADALAPAAEAQAVNAVREDWERISGQPARPGHGEIVGGVDAKLADELVALARTKGGKDKVQAKLQVIRAQSHHDGQKAADERGTKALVEAAKRIDEHIVCGFLAEVNHADKFYNGLPPDMVWSLPAITIVRIVDALNAAGYHSYGKD